MPRKERLYKSFNKEVKTMKMKAAVTWNAGDPFVMEEVELAAPKDDEILVKIAGFGLSY